MAFTAAVIAAAQDQPQQPVDPPGRVARLNYMSGTVSFRPGSQEDWGPATMNYPLTSGDHLWTDQQGGVEMHVGSTAVRLAGGTSFSVLNVDDHNAQISLSQGYLNVRMPRLDEGDSFEVDTPNGAVALLSPGDYRIDVNPDANVMTVTVRSGSAEVNGGGQTFAVNDGQHVRFSGTDQLMAETLEPAQPDEWDQWCMSRDHRDDQAVARVSQYVGNEMIGAEDLVDNGEWRSDPTYGSYWAPTRVAVDWAPYRYGHWAYVEPWGWTWIDDAPWGFAPFHYGRWAYIRGGWGWVPGPVVVRPVYAPALVAFVGGGSFGVGFGGGPVAAWVPLGPYEAYHPYYRVSGVYVTRVNYSYSRYVNVTNVMYVNRSYVTCVRQDVFVGARPVYAGIVRVPPSARFDRVDVVSYHPAREAYYGRRFEGARYVAPPREAFARPVVVTHAPPVHAGFRPAVAYRPAPVPTTRYEASGVRGAYHPVNTGRVSYSPAYRGATPAPNYGNRGNTGQPAYRGNPGQPNYESGQPSGRRFGRGGTENPDFSNRNATPNTPNYRNNNPPTTATPNYGNQGRGATPNYENQGRGATPNYGNQEHATPNYGNRPNTARPNYGAQGTTNNAPNYGRQPSTAPRAQPNFQQHTPPPHVQQQERTPQQHNEKSTEHHR